MKILQLVLGPLETNAYIVWCPETLESVIIDPADEADRILEEIKSRGLTLKKILLTHAHGDHIGAVDALRKATGAPVAQHESEKEFLLNPGLNLSIMFGEAIKTAEAEEFLNDGDVVLFGKEKLKVLYTPGHTPGGLSFLGDGVCFTGDLIFQESVGRTDFPDSSYDQLADSIMLKILVLPSETTLYSGHGPKTTVDHEMKSNPFL